MIMFLNSLKLNYKTQIVFNSEIHISVLLYLKNFNCVSSKLMKIIRSLSLEIYFWMFFNVFQPSEYLYCVFVCGCIYNTHQFIFYTIIHRSYFRLFVKWRKKEKKNFIFCYFFYSFTVQFICVEDNFLGTMFLMIFDAVWQRQFIHNKDHIILYRTQYTTFMHGNDHYFIF